MDEQENVTTNLSETDKLAQYMSDFVDWVVVFAPKLGLAIIILIVGFWLIKRVSKIFDFSLEKAQMAPEVISFLGSLVNMALKAGVLLIAAGIIGFEMGSLVAILAAVGFAVGMALQGSLGNFASGIMIMVFKPYKLGDFVEVSEKFGKVESIQIFLNVTMPYEESFPKVKQVILDALSEMPDVMREPVPTVGIESYDSHNVIISVRPFIKPEDYWTVTFEANSRIKEAFSRAGIKVAYSEGVELGPIGV